MHIQEPNNKIAVLDIGTNTFHIVIFEQNEHGLKELFRKRHHVFLSDEGIQRIADRSILVAQEAILDFSVIAAEYPGLEIQIIGTAALRSASNGPELAQFIEQAMGAKVQIISGKREAELIAKGVIWSVGHIQNGIIVDIGGGSVEFIHVLNNKIAWLDSFPVGIGVLYDKFRHSEPIEAKELAAMNEFITTTCQGLLDYLLTQKPIETLIGASGSFELLPRMINPDHSYEELASDISIEDFNRLRDEVWSKNQEERLTLPGLPAVRVKLFVVSYIIMNWIVSRLSIESVQISKYALKEGLVKEVLSR